MKERKKRIKKAEKKKQKLLTEIKIENKLKELPEHKRKLIREEEIKRRRLELKEAKENVWKKWRGRNKSERKDDTNS